MRIEGRWSTAGTPYVIAFLVCPKLNLQESIAFLVDTGASATVIMDNDAHRLKIDYAALKRRKEKTTGVGGSVDTYILPDVRLYFRTADGKLHEERMGDISVLKHAIKNEEEAARIRKLPSLLGRDFLNRYKAMLDRASDRLTITDEST